MTSMVIWEIIHKDSSEACLWTMLVDYLYECGLAFLRLVFHRAQRVFLLINYIIHTLHSVFGSFSESVFLECERDWFTKQSNEWISKKRWKFTYERSPVLTHGCKFTSFRIVFLWWNVFHGAERVFLYIWISRRDWEVAPFFVVLWWEMGYVTQKSAVRNTWCPKILEKCPFLVYLCKKFHEHDTEHTTNHRFCSLDRRTNFALLRYFYWSPRADPWDATGGIWRDCHLCRSSLWYWLHLSSQE